MSIKMAGLVLLSVTASIVVTDQASAQTYYAREQLKRGGTSAAPSTPPAPPQTSTCSAFETGKAPAGFAQRIQLGNATSIGQADQMCDAYLQSSRQSGICSWNSSPTTEEAGWPRLQVNYTIGGTTGTQAAWSAQTRAALHAKTCTAR